MGQKNSKDGVLPLEHSQERAAVVPPPEVEDALPRAAGAPQHSPQHSPHHSPATAAKNPTVVEPRGVRRGSDESDSEIDVGRKPGSFSLRGALRSKRSNSGASLKKRGTLRGSKAGAQLSEAELMRRRLDELFERYRAVDEDADDVDELELGADADAMGPNGIAAFLNDLGYGADDIVGFVLAWKLNARQLGRVTRQEFVTGLSALKCDSIAAVKALLPRLEGELKIKERARDIYSYAWQTAKPPSAKTLDLESAKVLLELFLPSSNNGHTAPFVDWIANHQSSYRAISKDQWDNLYDFALAVKADCSDYDEDDGWPCLLDEYVQWRVNGSETTADGC